MNIPSYTLLSIFLLFLKPFDYSIPEAGNVVSLDNCFLCIIKLGWKDNLGK